jgi:hypothetical protein
MLDSWAWELMNHVENRVPDPVDYIEMRRLTFGAEFGMSLAQLDLDPTIPREIFKTRTMRAIVNCAADGIALINDIVSYRKEIEIEGELNNCVLVVKQFMGLTSQQAIEIVRDISAVRIKQFEHVRKSELPTLIEQFELSSKAREPAQVRREHPELDRRSRALALRGAALHQPARASASDDRTADSERSGGSWFVRCAHSSAAPWLHGFAIVSAASESAGAECCGIFGTVYFRGENYTSERSNK